ncbi:MFS transporter [Phytoactinopolyspora endophytica]|uniref:MFS transporter n=1 Tax=Phytoactinopolyspora endophytica TaxID=1642495 RepID=UPI00197C2471|nr:MFS transporter [Phytoactinopolyspora endophytica]
MVAVTTPRAGVKEWVGLGVLALPTLLLGLDVTVLYLVLPTLAVDLTPSSTQTLWIMDVYGFLIAGFLITMGTLGDRVGRRRLLMIGAAAFGAASIVAAFADSAEMLIAARAALGIAGATLMPSTLALIGNMFVDVRQRGLAIGVWATMFALGMAVGPLVGGALLAHFWWGSAFLVAVPVIAVLLVSAPLVLPEYRAPRAGRIDLASVALSLAAILPTVYVVKHVAAQGFDTRVAAASVLGLACAVLFVRRQLVLESPLLDMKLFADRAFTAALSILLVGLVGVGGVMFLVTQYMQLVEGMSPTEAGLWMGPPALAMLAAAIGTPLVARRVRPGTTMVATLAVSAVGYILLAGLNPGEAVTAVVGFALVYLGLGAIAALGTDIVVGAAPPRKAGSAAAMSEMMQELGVAAGVALLGSLTTALYRTQIDERIVEPLPPDTAATVHDSLSAAVSARGQVPDAVIQDAAAAFTAGLNVAAVVAGTAIVAVAVFAAVSLRHVQPIGAGRGDDHGP